MEQVELFLIFTRPLDRLQVPYMATGSVAAMLYGIPRFTHDLDIVLDLRNTPVGELERMFPDQSFYRPPSEVIRVERSRSQRGHFNIIHHDSGLKADVYLFGQENLHKWAFDRKRRIQLSPEKGIWLAPPEYVILRKLQYYLEGHSDKHLHDIRGIMEVSADLIDQNALKDWIECLNLQNTFKDL